MNNINNDFTFYYFPASMIFFSDKRLNEIIKKLELKLII